MGGVLAGGVAYVRSLAQWTSLAVARPTPSATTGRAAASARRYEVRKEVDWGVRVGVVVQREWRRRGEGVEGRGLWRRRVAIGEGQRAANMIVWRRGN
jgi:hypothetical protein